MIALTWDLEWVLKGHGGAGDKNFDYLVEMPKRLEVFLTTTTARTPPTPDLTCAFVPVVAPGLFANVINANQFNVLINAAATNGDVKVLASPHILALDNKEAKIEIAQEVPVASTISQPQTTTELTTSQIQFKSVGTILTVTPQINEKKQVTLKISQEVSRYRNRLSKSPDRITRALPQERPIPLP